MPETLDAGGGIKPQLFNSIYLVVLSLTLSLGVLFGGASPSWAYPFYAQQNYASPREATGKIVCANCHRMLHHIPNCSLHQLRQILGSTGTEAET